MLGSKKEVNLKLIMASQTDMDKRIRMCHVQYLNEKEQIEREKKQAEKKLAAKAKKLKEEEKKVAEKKAKDIKKGKEKLAEATD